MSAVSSFATLSIAIPLLGLAGSAIAFVVKQYRESAELRNERFFRMIEYIDASESVMAKLAAIYALRQFKEHREFTIRFLHNHKDKVVGKGAQVVIAEMDHTLKALGQ